MLSVSTNNSNSGLLFADEDYFTNRFPEFRHSSLTNMSDIFHLLTFSDTYRNEIPTKYSQFLLKFRPKTSSDRENLSIESVGYAFGPLFVATVQRIMKIMHQENYT